MKMNRKKKQKILKNKWYVKMKINHFLVESDQTIIHRNNQKLAILIEGISDDMKEISDSSVTKPFLKFKNAQIASFAKKLHVWAITTLHEFGKNSYYNGQKHYLETLKKIINNPQDAASKMFATIVSKHISTEETKSGKVIPSLKNTEKPKDKEMKQIDDILSSLTF